MSYFKVTTNKGETVWVNSSTIFYVTSCKCGYRVYFSDGMYLDAVEITAVSTEEFLQSLA